MLATSHRNQNLQTSINQPFFLIHPLVCLSLDEWMSDDFDRTSFQPSSPRFQPLSPLTPRLTPRCSSHRTCVVEWPVETATMATAGRIVEPVPQSKNLRFGFGPNKAFRTVGKALACNSRRRSSKVLLISIFPLPPTMKIPPALYEEILSVQVSNHSEARSRCSGKRNSVLLS